MSASLLELAVRRHGAEVVYAALPPEARAKLVWEWKAWARPEQIAPPGDWLTWLLLAGRGFGKSRTGAEWSREKAKELPGSHGALVAPTSADARDVMVKTLLACTPLDEGLIYEPSKRALTWGNGTTATLYSAEEPDRLRGPQHHWAWVDEVAAWAYAEEVWDMLMMTLRLGVMPQVVASTTPRAVAIIRRLIKDSATVTTRGSTFDNSANLSAQFIKTIKERYEGTRLGRQELYAEILDDVPGALWTRTMLDKCRVKKAPPLVRVVVGLDPSGGAGERGIVAEGIGWCDCKGKRELHGFTLADASGVYTSDSWGRAAVQLYRNQKADRIVVEKNFGGDMAASLLRTVDPGIAVVEVTASRGKRVRAEPVAALYEQGKWHHVGVFPQLEDQMATYTPEDFEGSPDRMDAKVWASTALMLNAEISQPERIESSGSRRGGREDGIV